MKFPTGTATDASTSSRDARRSNVLWIVATQWRAQATGYAGDPNARTPHFDALAADSVDYAQAVTPHPFGPFARAALLTGAPSPENGVRDYYDPLPADARTVAHTLGSFGYETAFFGKWHLGKRDPRAPLVGEAHAKTIVPPGARGGFGFWEGFESGFLLNDPWLHGSRLPEPARFPGYQSDVLCERAGEWTRGRAAPWFCVVSLEAPHPPYDAPAGERAEASRPHPDELTLSANVPRGGDVEAKARRELAGYYSHIAATDAAVGRLLAAVDRENTLVVFTSVHGDMHGAHGLFRKGWPHEESVRVPLLVRSPSPIGGAPAATRAVSTSAVSLVDVARMTTDFVASGSFERAPRDFARISMPSVVALPHQCDRTWRGVRTASRKLVVNADGSPWLFFDLERDPGELTNLVGDPARAREMRELAEEVLARIQP